MEPRRSNSPDSRVGASAFVRPAEQGIALFIIPSKRVDFSGDSKSMWLTFNKTAKSSARFALWFAFLFFAAGPLLAQQPPPTVVFMTDFGVVDDSVALCKGVMYGITPNLRIVDLTHQVNAFSIRDGARFLFGATPYFPAGTVFVVVVDPGVGSSRKAVAVKSRRGQFFVLPDNGLMTMVEDRDGIEGIREITNPAWMVGAKISSTFHGRDIFSPVGAHLARGDDWTQVGPAGQGTRPPRSETRRRRRQRPDRRSDRARRPIRQPDHKYHRRRLSEARLSTRRYIKSYDRRTRGRRCLS